MVITSSFLRLYNAYPASLDVKYSVCKSWNDSKPQKHDKKLQKNPKPKTCSFHCIAKNQPVSFFLDRVFYSAMKLRIPNYLPK